jgi:hypothetical protein
MTSKLGPPYDYVLEEEIDDEMLLYNTEHGRFLSLNQTAADVWRLADGESTVDEVIDLLAAAYGVSSGDIRQDVEGVVARFRENRLLPG